MRVVSVIDSLAPGGAERSLVELAPALADHGVHLHVVTLWSRPGFGPELVDRGVPLTELPPAGRLGRARALARLLAAEGAALCHTTLFEADVAGRLAGTVTRTPVVTTLPNVRYGAERLAEPGLSPAKVRAAQALDVATARAVRRFHAVSETVAAAMATQLRVPRRRIQVVPRGRDRARLGWPSPERRRAVRAGLGLGEEQPLVLALARHEHQKGLDVLVRATGPLAARHPEVQVLVAGHEGNQTPTLEAAVAEAGLGGHVRLLGPRDDVGDLLAAADAFVLPSRREGLPGAVLEAMAMEVPLVVSDLPMVREAVPGDDQAVFVPAGDHTALADALAGVLADPATARTRALAARARFEDRFTLDAVAAAMAELLTAAARGA